ncbi:MAG: pyruvate:ferredoxin (flavodoxin) oxidoreductase [Rubrivivax sp.]|nr:pyruvate:ferredoxin (flavodoxin) oxidoreductase [Rubrivivax sp.]
MTPNWHVLDGNEAAARIAHLCSEVIAIYPITPSSTMGELADAWSAEGKKNLWGLVPQVIEMQSEGGAAGAVHGALQGGALSATFTASQGLMLKLPNMFKIAGELTSTVFHIAARTLATHALSIFGDHSDVMAARTTGFALLASSSVQEAQDLAAIAHMATLKSRVPFLHFFDGFRTSHEVNKIALLAEDDLRALIDEDLIRAHRARALNPDRPLMRGTAQNPDVFFQAREACNPYYLAVPGIVRDAMDAFHRRTGRRYSLFWTHGAPDADRVVVQMGSGTGATREAVDRLVAAGEKVALVTVRLYRPFDAEAFVAALPKTTRAIAVLDRTKEPGALGEPLYQDVVTALAEAWPDNGARVPRVIGGRYGLSSKEYTPAMAKAVFDELLAGKPRRHFTVGIHDDVTQLSLKVDEGFDTEAAGVTRAVFYGLGADGTVGATKNTVKIIGENTPLNAQGYFVYDSKKSGAITVSHLRFGPKAIDSTYLIRRADFVACHQFEFMEKLDVLELARPGATFLLNSPWGPGEVWGKLPREAQQAIIDRKLKFYVVDALAVARQAGLAGRINTVTQACFFALSGVLPRDEAIAEIKNAIRKTYGKRGETVLNRNFAAVDASLAAMAEVAVPAAADATVTRRPTVSKAAPDFVQRVTAMMMEGKGDLLPVSALPVDGTFPTGTTQWEKRSIAQEIPIWDEKLCTQCGICPLACPHAAIRMNVFPAAALQGAPAAFKAVPWTRKEAGLEGMMYTLQVAPEDCTGCGLCVDVCPTRSKTMVKLKAINMAPKLEHLERERTNYDFYLQIPEARPDLAQIDGLRGSQLRDPLFEYSGACAGCGETPYLKLLSQLYGDHLMVANATGCSSIYGGNLPTTPWSCNRAGQGPVWSNSLFEDNAEFGLGMRLAIDAQKELATGLVNELRGVIGDELANGLVEAPQDTDAQIQAQRARVARLKEILARQGTPPAARLLAVADSLVVRSVWIVGGDGWAYDIGYGGLDHVLASGRNVNILVLDTEVYSNTGGQASKSTPRGAVAKFAAAGKAIGKKDLGMIAMAYGNVYVAQVAMGANPVHTVRTFQEAASWNGPSLIIAYSHCIAHGIDMTTGMSHQREAVKSGYLTLYHYDPRLGMGGADQPLKLDSRKPTIPLEQFTMKEGRFAMLAQADPARAKQLARRAQADADARWTLYEQIAGVHRTVSEPDGPPQTTPTPVATEEADK